MGAIGGTQGASAEAAWRRARWPAAAWLRRLARAGYLLPAFAVYGVFVLWPLLRVLWLSLQRWDGYGTPTFIGLSNYATLVAEPGFVAELHHSLIWLAVTLGMPVLIGLGLALLLARAPAWLASLCRALLLVPLLLPSAVIAVIWKLWYNPLSGPLTRALDALGLGALAGDWLGDPRLALGALLVPACWASFGLSLLVFGAALTAQSAEVHEAAALDAAGTWARFRHLTVPSLRGALPLATVATALCAVPSFDLVALLTNGGPGYATTTLELDMEGRAFGLGQVGSGAALACVAALIGLVLTGVALVVARGHTPPGDDADGGRTLPRPHRGRRIAGLGLISATALLLLPVAWLVVQAGSAGSDGGIGSNIAAVWADGLGAAFAMSLGIAGVVTVGAVALAVPAAFALEQTRSRRGRALGLTLLAVGLFQPTEVLLIPLFSLLQVSGLFNTSLGVILPEIARILPLAILLLWGALRGLPAELVQAAAADGAAPRQILVRVALPLALPTVTVVAVWTFLSSWNEYLLPTIVLQDESLQTVPVALGHFIGRVDTQYALIATGALLASAPLLAVYAGGYSVLGAGLRRLRVPT
jgi:raffinose/stachyose/melibiose transport system permease protein